MASPSYLLHGAMHIDTLPKLIAYAVLYYTLLATNTVYGNDDIE